MHDARAPAPAAVGVAPAMGDDVDTHATTESGRHDRPEEHEEATEGEIGGTPAQAELPPSAALPPPWSQALALAQRSPVLSSEEEGMARPSSDRNAALVSKLEGEIKELELEEEIKELENEVEGELEEEIKELENEVEVELEEEIKELENEVKGESRTPPVAATGDTRDLEREIRELEAEVNHEQLGATTLDRDFESAPRAVVFHEQVDPRDAEILRLRALLATQRDTHVDPSTIQSV